MTTPRPYPTLLFTRRHTASQQIVVCLLPLGLVIACQGEPTTPTTVPASPGTFAALVTDLVVATVTVAPDSQLVFVGDRFKITGRPKNKAGQLLDRSVKWTVGTPTVATALDSLKQTMTFKALRVGTTSIKATVDGKYGSAKVVVRGTAGGKVVVTPAVATVVSGGTVGFAATGLTPAGETATVTVTWTATGGTIAGTGVLTAGNTPGTYRVVATSKFGAADTSIVTVTARAAPAAAVVLAPESASLAAGATVQFTASAGTSGAPVAVTYTGTGGTIAGGGLYTAGRAAGTYRVIAKSAAGAADTAVVVISAAPTARVVLLPDMAASRPGETTRFVAGAWNTLGDSVPKTVTYGATCGTVTSAGVFTAPRDETDRCLVTATVDGKADTTEVLRLPNTPNQGVPFGTYDLWTSATATQTSGAAAFTGSLEYLAPRDILSRIDAARALGVRLVLALTGGAHTRYTTNGVFDLAKWEAAVDGYNTAAIRDAVAKGVADGTIIGNSVMDEPQQSGNSPTSSWGPPGTMTKARVDGLCAYVKAIFPTLPVGVGHDYSVFEPNNSYRVCEILISQYAWRRNNGNIIAYRDGGLAFAARDGMAIIFSVNILNGGPQDKSGAWDCPGTGGLGTHSPNCQVTPAQLRDWGKVLGQAGCALLTWQYDAAFMAKPENQAAISDVAITLSGLPRKPCTGTRTSNTPPSAAFASSCTELACSFTDGSTDAEGPVSGWSWDFGDGTSSTTQNPSHAYAAEGTYQIILTVSDAQNATNSVTHSLTVTAPPANAHPTAAFTSSCTELACSFTDGSTDAEGPISGWSWDFGDGTSSTTQNPSHAYAAEGTYQVILTVSDAQNATNSVTHTLTVTAPPVNAPPTAAFTISCTDLTCSFTDASTDEDGTVAAWSWDFGDGTSSTSPDPTHTYAAEGSYDVTLTATDDQDATQSVTRTVTVTAPPPPEGDPAP